MKHNCVPANEGIYLLTEDGPDPVVGWVLNTICLPNPITRRRGALDENDYPILFPDGLVYTDRRVEYYDEWKIKNGYDFNPQRRQRVARS